MGRWRAAYACVLAGLLGLWAMGRPVGAWGPQPSAPADVAGVVSLLRAGDFQRADAQARQLLAAGPLDGRGQAVCALARLKAGFVEEAEPLLRSVIARVPDQPESHLGLGRLARARNDDETAVVHLRKALASSEFADEAARYLWRAAWSVGRVADLRDIHRTVAEQWARTATPVPSLIMNGLGQLAGLDGGELYRLEGTFERFQVPLAVAEGSPRIRTVSLTVNGKGEYPFDIDSALVDFLTVSPLLAEELGLTLSGSATSTGVGTATIATRFAVLDSVRFGPVTFRQVPVMVSESRTFQGRRKGLLGTGFLRRFNVTIDVAAETMTVVPLDRPELLEAAIDRRAVVADVPLYLFDQTVVRAAVGGAPPALYILDSAAATHLVDIPFSAAHIRPGLAPARMLDRTIQGAGGAQQATLLDGVPVALGPLTLDGQQVHEFRMATLNGIAGRYAAGLIGNPALWPYRVHVDFRRGRLILERRPPAGHR